MRSIHSGSHGWMRTAPTLRIPTDRFERLIIVFSMLISFWFGRLAKSGADLRSRHGADASGR
jgi:hypothetical protein